MRIKKNKQEFFECLYEPLEKINKDEPGYQEKLKQALHSLLTFAGISSSYRARAKLLLEQDIDDERKEDVKSLLFRLDEADRAVERGDTDAALMHAFLAGKMVVAIDALPWAKIGYDAQAGRCKAGSKEKTDPYFIKLLASLKKQHSQKKWKDILETLKSQEWHIDDCLIEHDEYYSQEKNKTFSVFIRYEKESGNKQNELSAHTLKDYFGRLKKIK